MKQQRQQLILDLLRRRPIESQSDLVRELALHGVHANQATVSRDIKELGLVKAGHRYATANGTGPRATWSGLSRIFREHVGKVDAGESLIVIKTPPGRAHLVASTIDTMDDDAIVGTVAGDDTLLVVPRSRKAQAELLRRFRSMLP